MDDVTARAMKLIMREISEPLALLGVSPAEVDSDFDLVNSGVLDSMRFLELLGALEQEFGCEIDLQEFEVEEVTKLGGLVRAVQGSAHNGHE